MNTLPRRSFLAALGAGLCAPAVLRARGRAARHRLAFSTLPEIEEPEVAFPQYARVMAEYLAEAGVAKTGS